MSKGPGGDHVTYFWNFGTPFIYREWSKVETSNLAYILTTRGPNEKKCKIRSKGLGRGHVTYSVSQKSSAPQPPPRETFCNIFCHAKYICIKCCQYIACLDPHIFTNFRQFRHTLIFNKMALIFLGVLIVFNVSSFDFQQVKLPWLHRQWWVVPDSTELNPLDYQVWGKCWSFIASRNRS